MLPREQAHDALRRLFSRHIVADLPLLFEVLDTTARMSVFRRLRELGYLASYTHAGRYYTLGDIPQFDEAGLWFFRAVGFSRFGTLRATLVQLVERSEQGLALGEIHAIARVRVQDPLLHLVRRGEIARRQVGERYVYVSPHADRAEEQMRRRATVTAEAKALSPTVLVEVLVEVVHAGGVVVKPATVAARLAARGVMVSAEAIARVFERYGLLDGKKTARSL